MGRAGFKGKWVRPQAPFELHVLLDGRQTLGYESAAAVSAPRQIKKTDQET
ncbi:hypothetical protein [Pseudomonas graminis]|uniref:hypothetical protein n=1 Tax=Pseudomonas graminis TaxID=158627 RepID=UPI003C2A03B3